MQCYAKVCRPSLQVTEQALQLWRLRRPFNLVRIWVEAEQRAIFSATRFVDIHIAHNVWVGIDVLRETQVARRTPPFFIARQIVSPVIACAGVGANLKSNADRR